MEVALAMSENLNGISRKVASMLRRLGDGTDRDILLTIHMLRQVLITAGTDIHAVADRIEEPPSQKLTAADVQAIYDKGFADGHSAGAEQGRRSAVIATARPMGILDTSDVGPGVNGHSWFEIAQHCAAHKDRIYRDKDRDFIDSIFEQIAIRGRSPSPPQAKWLRDIFNQRFGGGID